MKNEAHARIKINKLLEESAWRFFDSKQGKANICLENNVKIKEQDFDEFGNNFEKTKNGKIDFLLLDEKGFPLIVLEAKSEEHNPLIGKEQARRYAKNLNCRFVIISNGNLHYFWDLKRGNPFIITKYPTQSSISESTNFIPNPQKLISEIVKDDYITLTQRPNYQKEAGWNNPDEKQEYIKKNKLRFLRYYQLQAVHSIQREVKEGNDRFLFEMATGTGKTLTSAAVIKLFLKTGNARRVLFLVDRLELEDQAKKAFDLLLKNDFQTVIYKENRQDWRKAEIVVTTVQSLLHNNKYTNLFSPTDFDLVISDEAHRSINGNARAVFEYFPGYKLGLTATPKDYLKNFDKKNPTTNDPREYERRLLRDTYKTFGCESREPTFRYSLLDGVKDDFLINPIVLDARTDITTQLLSEKGYSVLKFDENNEEEEQVFYQRHFEKKFFSGRTNKVLCKTFLENALRDPVSGEMGKSIVFCVSQNHAAKITQILNEMADKMFPNKYNSDFAIQITSRITDAKQFTINFTNNNLNGSANIIDSYKTGKTRVCVAVGMMTTGYDCPDLLNLCLMRPIFSPTDFIQMKGRGTRKHNFLQELFDEDIKEIVKEPDKIKYKLFDFFANCEYFEETFNYDEVLTLQAESSDNTDGTLTGDSPPTKREGIFENFDPDILISMDEEVIGLQGMRVDRMFFQKFEEKIREDEFVKEKVNNEKWDEVTEYINDEILNKPDEFFSLSKLRKAAGVDRRLSLREIIEKIFGLIPKFKMKDDILEEEFIKFINIFKPTNSADIPAIKYYFKAYISNNQFRDIIENKRERLIELHTNPSFNMQHYKAVPNKWRSTIPEYIKDYVPLNQFMN